jgi:uncharacterized protein
VTRAHGDAPRSPLAHLLDIVLGQYRLSPHGTHGVHHWGRVLENARVLARLSGADEKVLECFAVLHDSCRRGEGRDPDHGPRGAALAERHRAAIDLDDARFALLVEACECHTRGPRRDADITVLACLDADRLDISRVGMRVDTTFLLTEAGRNPRILRWAGDRGARGAVPRVCAEEWGWPAGRTP